MLTRFTEITGCRLCKSDNIYTVCPFGPMPLANSYPTTNEPHQEELFPLTLMRCDDCGHVQLKETVTPSILFVNYLYSSSDSPALVNHFKEYASTVVSRFGASEYTQVLEFGSNDGILLREFANLGLYNLVGVDPAINLAEKAKTGSMARLYPTFFDEHTAKKILGEHGPFDFICANNTFAHIADLDSVVKGVAMLLSMDGVFVFENAYLLDTIKNLYFDQIYHEHLQYYALKPLIKYFRTFNLEIFDIERVNVQGGSFRIFVKHGFCNKHAISDNVAKFVKAEEDFGLDTRECFKKFCLNLEVLQWRFGVLLNNINAEGKTVCCYGCPAKFALFSKYLGMKRSQIKYVVDDSPLKQGRVSPGLNIPIVSRQHFLDNPTDYCIISVWNMAYSIIQKNSNYTGKFIVPLPNLTIL